MLRGLIITVTDNYMDSTLLENLTVAQLVPKDSLSSPQEPTTESCPKPYESLPQASNRISLRSILILSAHKPKPPKHSSLQVFRLNFYTYICYPARVLTAPPISSSFVWCP
jgi:hypothetical protein